MVSSLIGFCFGLDGLRKPGRVSVDILLVAVCDARRSGDIG